MQREKKYFQKRYLLQLKKLVSLEVCIYLTTNSYLHFVKINIQCLDKFVLIFAYRLFIMTNTKPQQKLVSFSDNAVELEKISMEMEHGWSIISLVKNGSYYVGIMELLDNSKYSDETIYIPPRKKIKISG